MKLFVNLKNIVADIYIRLVLFLVNFFPGGTSNDIRMKFQSLTLKLIKVRVGRSVQLSPGFFVFSRGRVIINDGSRLGYGFSIWNHSDVFIGKNMLASHGIKIIAATHQRDASRTNLSGPVTIGDNVWIGADVTIVGPCMIGDNVVIGAKAFVTGTIDRELVIGGVPARPLNVRST